MKPIIILFFFISISISCFSQAGFLDYTFGDSGKTYLSGLNYNYCGTVQPDDKILAGGEAYLARFLPDGTLDESFGNGGRIGIFPLSILSGVYVLEDGKIITGGISQDDIGAAKFKSNGKPDSSFGENG